MGNPVDIQTQRVQSCAMITPGGKGRMQDGVPPFGQGNNQNNLEVGSQKANATVDAPDLTSATPVTKSTDQETSSPGPPQNKPEAGSTTMTTSAKLDQATPITTTPTSLPTLSYNDSDAGSGSNTAADDSEMAAPTVKSDSDSGSTVVGDGLETNAINNAVSAAGSVNGDQFASVTENPNLAPSPASPPVRVQGSQQSSTNEAVTSSNLFRTTVEENPLNDPITPLQEGKKRASKDNYAKSLMISRPGSRDPKFQVTDKAADPNLTPALASSKDNDAELWMVSPLGARDQKFEAPNPNLASGPAWVPTPAPVQDWARVPATAPAPVPATNITGNGNTAGPSSSADKKHGVLDKLKSLFSGN